nr:reverse transcriptase domain-containing protein [Tanacetum cinerariifolium]
MMVDQRTMAQLLQAPTEGYEDAIVVPAITADNFELNEAQDRFKDLLRACPHHGFSELHQLDTFYNALNSKNQDSLNSAAGGNFLDKMPRECLAIIESKSKVSYSRNKPVVAKVSTNTSTYGISPDVAELKDLVKALLLDKKSQNQAPATVKAVEESCVTCGGSHSYRNCPATDDNVYRDNIQEFVSQASVVNYDQRNTSYRPPMMSNQIRPPGFPPVPNNQNVQLNQRNNQNRFNQNQNRGNNFNQGPVYQPSVFQPPAYQAPAYQAPAPQTQGVSKEDFQPTSGTLPSNTIANPRSDLKAITTRSGVSYDGPQISHPPSFLPKVVQNEPEPVNSSISKPVISLLSAPRPNQRPSIPYPSRLQDQKLRDKANDQREKFFQIFKYLNFNISFADALILMPKFGPSIKSLLTNKDKLYELTRTPLNEHCLTVLLKKLPEKLGDPGKFLISCDFPKKAECLALADLDASINLMPLSVWNKLSLPDLTHTCMTLELIDRSISRPVGVAEDVYVKVGSFHFLADFVVVNFDADPRVPLILERSFLKTGRALIDVFEGELTLRVGKEAITFNLDQTSRYSANYNEMTAKRIDVIDMACEEYSQEVLGFSDVIVSSNPTPYYDPIVSTTSLTLTPFENTDFLLEEVDAFLALEDDPTSPKVDQSYLDYERDILLLESFLNDYPLLPPLNQGNYLPEVRKELKIREAKSKKSSIDEPPELELTDLPPHLEYAFLEGDDKLPVIIAKDLSMEEKTALITVLKSHKRAVAWKLSDIKGGFTVVENEDNELIPIRLVMGWRVCIDYRKLNEATHKDHFPLSFMDQMLERLARNQYYYFLDGFSGYFQILINPKDQEKTTFTCPYGTFAYCRMPFGKDCAKITKKQSKLDKIEHEIAKITQEPDSRTFFCVFKSQVKPKVEKSSPLRGGFCLFCDSKAENSFTYDPNAYSFNEISNNINHLPQTQYETYLCELCGNNSHYGYDCQPQFLFVYEQEPSYNQNYNDNYYLHDLPSCLCCDNCEGSHATFQCQPMDQNNDSSSFDQIQPPHLETNKQYQPEEIQELMCKLLEDVRNIREELAEYINSPSWNYPTFYDDDEEHLVQYKEYLEKSSDAIAPVLPIEEPEYSLSMGYEHLNTTPETESDEIIKSGVKNLIRIPNEYEVTSEDESECDLPVCEDHYEILFDSKNDDISSDDDAFEDIEYVEATVLDSELVSLEEENDFLNDNPTPDCVLKSSSSFLIFEEFDNSLSDNFSPEFETFSDHTEETTSGSTTTHANKSLPEYDSFCFEIELDQGSLISVVMKDISDDSSNDPPLEEVDLFLASDNSIPPGIENFDYDSDGDIHFLEELLVDDSIPFPESGSSNFDHQNDLLFPRPPLEPSDVEFYFDCEPNSGEVISAVINNIDELNK